MTAALARNALVRHGLVGGLAMAALILLCVFYSVVAAAVDRAAERREAKPIAAVVATDRSSQRPPVAINDRVSATPAFAARAVSYLRPAN